MKEFVIETKKNTSKNDKLFSHVDELEYYESIDEAMLSFKTTVDCLQISTTPISSTHDIHASIYLKVWEGDTVVTLKHCFIHNGEVL